MAIHKKKVDQALADVDPCCTFYVCDGRVLKNLSELLEAFENMDNATYSFHVNKEKNDFSNWIKDIIKDEVLAKKIFSKDKKSAIKIISERIKYYKKKL